MAANGIDEILNILGKHHIRFVDIDSESPAATALIVDVPDHMGCFEVLDVMCEIKKEIGIWVELNDPVLMSDRGFSKAQQVEIARQRALTDPATAS